MAGASRDALDRARGALLGTFVGDALGMPFEGAGAEAVAAPLEMEEARLGRGTYTDDTQMTIALAESLLACGRVDEEHLARAFLELYDPRRGYGAGTTEVLARWRAGEPVAAASSRLFGGQGSMGNGAAMRVAPIGVMFAGARDSLSEQAERSARLTHAHPLGVDAAVVQAAAVAAGLTGGDALAEARAAARTAELRTGVERASELLGERPTPGAVAAELGTSSAGPESVPAAIYAAAAHRSLEDAVTFAVRCGGDTDTIGAMAGAIAGARDGASAIPGRWLEALEDGERGRAHVERLADRLVGRS